MAETKALGVDVHSYANFDEIRTTHLNLVLEIDFKEKILFGYVDVQMRALKDGVSFIDLDTRCLNIDKVVDPSNNKSKAHTMPKEHRDLGVSLHIPLESKLSKDEQTTIRVYYKTTPQSAGIQWFEPSQTAGKQHPFMYTQCEAILSRTLLPCQDVPAVKAPYSIQITCASPLVACCSGTPVGEAKTQNDGKITYHYEQKNPIPAYLIAIVCGKLVKAPVGPRSSVWCEEELLKKAEYEFSEDTEKYIQAGEEITGMKYEWGVYDMVILPSAFPYGGMENPNLTFLSASLLAGDRSLTNVVAHEIVHSWAGNYTTNSSWSDFWLNEGFTVYIERMILGKVFNSSSYRDFESLLGYFDLVKTVKVDYDDSDHEFTKLTPNLTDIDPDEAFNKIPYEKGSLFLRYLESKVGGQAVMMNWLKTYFQDFRFKSLDTPQMKSHFLNYFKNVAKVSQEVLDSIQWDAFLTKPGIPSLDLINPDTLYDKSMAQACIQLADRWDSAEENKENFSEHDLDSFKSRQKMFFLDSIISRGREGKPKVTPEKIDLLDRYYHFSQSPNVEIVYRFLMLCLLGQHKKYIPNVCDFLSKYGRGLYVNPLYKALIQFDKNIAQETYQKNKNFYHTIICNRIEGMLKA